jgi:2-haloacid dehalogenase
MPLNPFLDAGVKGFVFDAYGTIFDVHSAVALSAAAIGPSAQAFSDLWRSKQLEYSWVRTLAGEWRDFWRLTEEALDVALARNPAVDPALRPALLSAYRTLGAYPEARGALRRLRAGGFAAAILSNGETSMLADAVSSAGLGGDLDATWSVDLVRVYKPDPRVYALATEGLRLAPHELCMVSSNRWDVAGATAFGMRAIWVNRAGAPDEYADLAPVATVSDLNGVG